MTTSAPSLSLPDERHPLSPPTDDILPTSALPASKSIPTTFSASLSAWWKHESETEMKVAEERLLRRVPSFLPSALTPDPTPSPEAPNPLVARSFQTILGESVTSGVSPANSSTRLPVASSLKGKCGPAASPRYLNGLSFYTAGKGGTKQSGSKSVNVLLHGYGAALGFFFLNLQAFGEASSLGGRRAYALDWLGMGLSARPSPKAFDPPPGVKETVQERVARAEDFFIDSLEEWRKINGHEKMTLIGHSLGGYLSTAYSLKYPSRVDRLILISPAGVPNNSNPVPDPADAAAAAASAASAEVSEPRSVTQEGNPMTAQQAAASARKDAQMTTTKANSAKEAPPSRPRLRAFFGWAWEKGWSPFGVLRGIGPFGPKLVGVYSTRRFEGLSEEDVKDMHAYIYSTSVAKGSGEYCISHILAPGAYARMPLCQRMDNIKVPVSFVYGDKDWMDYRGGLEACKRMKAAGNHNVETIIVENAGHHVYLDNPRKMNDLLLEWLSPMKP